jgi:hypothetical protein
MQTIYETIIDGTFGEQIKLEIAARAAAEGREVTDGEYAEAVVLILDGAWGVMKAAMPESLLHAKKLHKRAIEAHLKTVNRTTV